MRAGRKQGDYRGYVQGVIVGQADSMGISCCGRSRERVARARKVAEVSARIARNEYFVSGEELADCLLLSGALDRLG